MALKILKPTMRDKKRYLLLEGNFTKKQAEEKIMHYVGVLGYSKASPVWISSKILAVNRSEIDKIRGAFAFSGTICVKKVSGSLKGLKGK